MYDLVSPCNGNSTWACNERCNGTFCWAKKGLLFYYFFRVAIILLLWGLVSFIRVHHFVNPIINISQTYFLLYFFICLFILISVILSFSNSSFSYSLRYSSCYSYKMLDCLHVKMLNVDLNFNISLTQWNPLDKCDLNFEWKLKSKRFSTQSILVVFDELRNTL